MAWHGVAGGAGQGMAWPGPAWYGVAGVAWWGVAGVRPGKAGLGAVEGRVWRGTAWQGSAGSARLGWVRHGMARLGKAGMGKKENEMSEYMLDNVEIRAAEHPTFELPSIEERSSLQVGDIVKLIFEEPDGEGGERMWVVVTEVDGTTYHGTLDNEPLFLDVQYGDLISFGPEHVIDIMHVRKPCTRKTSRLG